MLEGISLSSPEVFQIFSSVFLLFKRNAIQIHSGHGLFSGLDLCHNGRHILYSKIVQGQVQFPFHSE